MKKSIQFFIGAMLAAILIAINSIPFFSQEPGVLDLTKKTPITSDFIYVFYIVLAVLMLLCIVSIFLFWSYQAKKGSRSKK